MADLTDEQQRVQDVGSKIMQDVDQSFPEGLREFVAKLEEQISGFNNVTTKLNSASSTFGTGLEQAKRAVDDLSKTYQKQTGEMNKVSIGQNLMSGLVDSSTFIKSAKDDMTKAFQALRGESQSLNNVLGSAGPILAANLGRRALDKLNAISGGMLDVQKSLMGMERSAIQVGAAFGDSFGGASSSAEMFMDRQAEIQSNLYATNEDLAGLRDSFKGALDLTDQMSSLDGLSKAQSQFGTTLNATSAAFAIGSAVGMEHKDVAGMIAQSYTELGENLSGAIANFGAIAGAAENSGLGFEKVAKSIMDSTSTLKMFGGTVGAVAPIYRAFSNSLEEGKKGLAPELLNQYTKGLQGLSLAQRAFMGMQTGMGGKGVGAIGAGLKMEAALEKGPEGMKEVSDSLAATLKQYGGGEIVTREQAIENPALERQFVVQRQLLMQMMNLDQASANQTLGMLQSIDQNGLAGISGQEEKLGNLLSKGEQTQQSTTDLHTSLSNLEQAAIKSGADQITSELRAFSDKTGAGQMIRGFREALQGAATRGSVDLGKDFGKFASIIESGKPSEEQARRKGRATSGGGRGRSRQMAVAQGKRQAETQTPPRGLFSGFRQAQTSGRGIATSLSQARRNSARIAQAFNNIKIPEAPSVVRTQLARTEQPKQMLQSVAPAAPPLPEQMLQDTPTTQDKPDLPNMAIPKIELPAIPDAAPVSQQLVMAKEVADRQGQSTQRTSDTKNMPGIQLPELPTGLPILPGDKITDDKQPARKQRLEQRIAGAVEQRRPAQRATANLAQKQSDEPRSMMQRLTDTITQGKAGMRARNEVRRTGGTEADMMVAENRARQQARANSIRPPTAPVAAGVEATTAVRRDRAVTEQTAATTAAPKKQETELVVDLKVKPGAGTSIDIEPIIQQVNRKQHVESKS